MSHHHTHSMPTPPFQIDPPTLDPPFQRIANLASGTQPFLAAPKRKFNFGVPECADVQHGYEFYLDNVTGQRPVIQGIDEVPSDATANYDYHYANEIVSCATAAALTAQPEPVSWY
eukprot:GDKI01029551.1.p1 GENE.GDKI01029551.1~~GDKI01029551.1.p1  ORF type:complete len:116 (-),score=18.66 GDKI01029551.1:60-407(-)